MLFVSLIVCAQENSISIPIEETIYNALNLTCEQSQYLELFKNNEIKEKEFKKHLTRAQRSKLSMIKKLARLERKRLKHKKNYYVKNPQMQKFGDECMFDFKNAVNK